MFAPSPTTSITVPLKDQRVRFTRCGDRVVVTCDCARGERGFDCEHPAEALLANPALASLDQLNSMVEARLLLAGSTLEAQLERCHGKEGTHTPKGCGELGEDLGMGPTWLQNAPRAG